MRGLDDLARLLGRGLESGGENLKRLRRASPGDVPNRVPQPGRGSLRNAPQPQRPPPSPQAPPIRRGTGRVVLATGAAAGLGFGAYRVGQGLGGAAEDGGLAGVLTGASPEQGGALGGLFGDPGADGSGGLFGGSTGGGSLLTLALIAGGGFLAYKALKKDKKGAAK